MARFFISYRKRDTGADAELIAKSLSDGEHVVFLDRQGIVPGDDSCRRFAPARSAVDRSFRLSVLDKR
jgi:hypothetical protein